MKKAIESEKVAELMMRPALEALGNSKYSRECPNYRLFTEVRLELGPYFQNSSMFTQHFLITLKA